MHPSPTPFPNVRIALLPAALLLAAPLIAQRAGDRLLVCNKAANSVSIFDVSVPGGREVATLPTGEGPHEVAVSPDGRTAVVTDYGAQKPGHTLTVVDVVQAKVRRTIDLRRPGDDDQRRFLRPHGIRFVGAHVLLTSESTRRLVRVDPRTGAIARTWPTAQPSMHMVSVTTDGGRAWATSIADGTVACFDLAASVELAPKPIATGKGAEGLAVHPRTGDAWVANRDDDTIAIVSAQRGEIVARLDTGRLPFRVAFTPAGARALVTCAESGELMVFDTAGPALLREVSIHGDRSEQSSLP
ncbi:MAG: hypothetical protein KAI24_06170, partial [Planctomycetes bacterium]|nr:hypothetical protein [Planctomycetota bacterium]